MQTIFKDLENLKIPYIIGVAKSKLKNAYVLVSASIQDIFLK